MAEVALSVSEIREANRAKSNANLIPFKPGQVANPLGRGRIGTTIREAAEEVAHQVKTYEINGKKVTMTRGKRIVEVLYSKAERGNLQCLKLLLDRLWPVIHHSKSMNINAGPSDILAALEKLKADVAATDTSIPGPPPPQPTIDVTFDGVTAQPST